MLKNACRAAAVVWPCGRLAVLGKLLCGLLAALLPPLQLLLMQGLIDSAAGYIRGTVPPAAVCGALVWLLLAVLGTAAAGHAGSVLDIALHRGTSRHLGEKIAARFLALEYRCFEDSRTADAVRRMGDAPQQQILEVFSGSLSALALLLGVLGTATVFLQVSAGLFWLLPGLLAPMLWLEFQAMRQMNTLLDGQSPQERRCDYLGSLLQDKNVLLECRLFGAAPYIAGKWQRQNRQVLAQRLRMTLSGHKYFAAGTAMLLLWAGAVLFTLMEKIGQGAVSLGLFVTLAGSVSSTFSACRQLAATAAALSKKQRVMTHYAQFMALPLVQPQSGRADLSCPQIVFEDVHFTYPGADREILKGLNLTLTPGRRAALVGENGAGKSTVIKLLCGLYRPTAGRITVGGADITTLSAGELQKVYSVVFQDYGRYALTLRENIAFGDIRRLHDDAALRAAMEKGLAGEVLAALDGNLEADLGKLTQEGRELSGGQWQRLAIARACLSQSPFVILDEPTAALDPIAESQLYEGFLSVLEGRGCLLISHRLGSARLAQDIHVLQDGVIVQSGTHAQLLAAGGLYAQMYRAQSGWYAQKDRPAQADAANRCAGADNDAATAEKGGADTGDGQNAANVCGEKQNTVDVSRDCTESRKNSADVRTTDTAAGADREVRI